MAPASCHPRPPLIRKSVLSFCLQPLSEHNANTHVSQLATDSTASMHDGVSFLGLFTRVPTGQEVISSEG